MMCEHAIIQEYTYNDFTAERMSADGIMTTALDFDNIGQIGADFWRNVAVPWAEGGFDLFMSQADTAKQAVEWMGNNFINLASFYARLAGYDDPREDPSWGDGYECNFSSGVSGTIVYQYTDEYNVTSIEEALFTFVPAYIKQGFPVVQGEHLNIYAVDRLAGLDLQPSVTFSQNTTGFREITFNGNTYYGFESYVNSVWSTNTVLSGIWINTNAMPVYRSNGTSSTTINLAGQIKSIAYATNEQFVENYGGFYIPGGSYNYEDYMNTIVNNFNESHPDNPIPPDYIPTFEQSLENVYPSGGDTPGGGGSGTCICNHYYQAGAFSEGAFSGADITVEAGAGAFDGANIDVTLDLGGGGFGAGAFGAGAFADADINLNGDLHIDGGLTVDGVTIDGAVTNNYDGATVTNNNTYSGTVNNTFDGATVNQNYDGAEITNSYEGANITQNVTIDGSDIDWDGFLNGEPIEDIHTDIVQETVSIDDLEGFINGSNDDIGKQLVYLVPDMMNAGFSVLDAWDVEDTFQHSALIAFIWRIIGGA